MTFLTGVQRERRVIELLEQGKSTRDIAKDVHISFADIGSIRKKHFGEMEAQTRNEEGQEKVFSKTTEAFKLFVDGDAPIQVAIKLDLGAEEVTRIYKEYCDLNGLHNLYRIYEEVKSDIPSFVKLYNHTKNAGISPQQVVNALNHLEELPTLETRNNDLKNEFSSLTYRKQNLLSSFDDLNHQMLRTKRMLDHDDAIIDLKRQEIEQLSYEKQQLENFIVRLKTNNKEYQRVVRIAKDKVSQVLDDKRVMLNAAIGSVLGALREHPEKQLLIYDSLDASTFRTSSIPLGIDSRQYRQVCLEMLRGLAEELYDKLLNSLVDSTTSSAAYAPVLDLQSHFQLHPP
jgi:hypothetical protein